MDQENIDAIREAGVLVYLKISPEQLALRLLKKNHRPMVSGPSGERLDPASLQVRVMDLLAQRDHYYRQADVVVEGTDKSVGHMVDEIARRLIVYMR